MPINPNIALSVQQQQPQPVNYLAQMGQAMALKAASQEMQGNEDMRNLFAGGANFDDPEFQRRGYMASPKGFQELLGKRATTQKTEIEALSKEIDLRRDAITNIKSPEDYLKWHDANHTGRLGSFFKSAGISPSRESIMAELSKPGGLDKLKRESALGATALQKELMQTERSVQVAGIGAAATRRGQDLLDARAKEGTWSNFNVGRRVMQVNSRTGEIREVQDPYDDKGFNTNVGPIITLPETPAGGSAAPAKTNMLPSTVGATSPVVTDVNGLRNPPAVNTTAPVGKTRPPVTNPLMVEEKPVWNEKAGVFMYPPSEDNPKGKVLEVPALQEAVQKRTANATLKVAGYDPKTGTDEVSNLIKKSTSGLGENWANKAWSAITGTGSEGAEAIGKLETRANEMTLALAPNGSLGAGFSNEDRLFMLGKLGDVANPNKAMNVRLAAWEDVMERTARNAGVPYTKQALSSSTKSSPKVIQFGELPK
jgi:hypothetical protein